MENKEFIKGNINYFERNFDSKSENIILFESFYENKNLIYGITKVGLTLSSILNLKPICILPPSNKNHTFIKSLCKNVIYSKSLATKSLIKNFIFLTITFLTINRKKLLELTVDGINIGKYIYDAILIHEKIITIGNIKTSYRITIIKQIAFYFSFKEIFLKNNIKFLVLGDNTYTHGLLFELSKKFNVQCITPINLNSFQLSKYTSKEHYDEHCFSITNEYLEKIKNKEEALKIANNYFKKRFAGSIEQHDVLNAFKNKKIKTKEQFCRDYKLDNRKKIVAIAPHVFCDAPHAYPNTLYSDNYEWFLESMKILSLNENINIIVKEHPSAHLYGENEKLDQILKENNFKITKINPNENQYSLLQSTDIIVTCGGTVGLEFSCLGKPVILAANPPYSNLGFTIDSKSKENYKENLLNCHLINNLSESQKNNALLTAYLSYCNNDVMLEEIEIGSETISLGKNYEENKLLNDIREYQKTSIEKQYIYSYLKSFINNPNRLGLKL